MAAPPECTNPHRGEGGSGVAQKTRGSWRDPREPPRSDLIRNPSPDAKNGMEPHTRAHMENGVRWRTRRNGKSSKGKSTTPGQNKTD